MHGCRLTLPKSATAPRRAAERRRRRGFSLIELLVALALTALVTSLALGVMVRSRALERVRSQRSALIREGVFASTLLTNTLRRAGLGVPKSAHLDFGTRAFGSVVLWGDDNLVGIVADVERPHAPFSTMGTLHGKAPSGGARKRLLAWHTENNGGCIPNSPSTCVIADTSVFFPGQNGCDAGTDKDDRVCAWGLKRLEAGDNFIIVDGSGEWSEARFASGADLDDRGGFYLRLTGDYADQFSAWPNDDNTPPHEATGLGFVSTPDRLFFRLCEASGLPGACNTTNPPFVLQRKQCWGSPRPDDASWPALSAGTFPTDLQSGVPGNTCHPAGDTEWETILNDVASYSFRYFNSADTELTSRPLNSTDRPTVARIQYRMTLSRTINGRVISHDLVGTAAVRN